MECVSDNPDTRVDHQIQKNRQSLKLLAVFL